MLHVCQKTFTTCGQLTANWRSPDHLIVPFLNKIIGNSPIFLANELVETSFFKKKSYNRVFSGLKTKISWFLVALRNLWQTLVQLLHPTLPSSHRRFSCIHDTWITVLTLNKRFSLARTLLSNITWSSVLYLLKITQKQRISLFVFF